MPGLVLDLVGGSVTLEVPLHEIRECLRQTFPRAGEDEMKVTERRQLARLNLRTPLRFRALGVASDKTEHFTEALNVSRGGFFFASSAPLRSEEHTSELQSQSNLVCRLLLEKKKSIH